MATRDNPQFQSIPIVTVLIPARSEESDIGRAIEGVLSQDFPHDRMEVVVVTGGSTDRTGDVARELLSGGDFDRVQVVDKPDGSTPSNLNAGLAVARGTYICRVDARSIIPANYVSRCVELMSSDMELAVVGGAQLALPRSEKPLDLGIARALNNRWGMGLSKYRSGSPSGPTDTVYLGAFRTEQLRSAGGWDERFATNQDFELNRRMSGSGVVWFDSSLAVNYLPRTTIRELFEQYRRFGRWKVRYWRLTGDRPQPRQWILLTVPTVAAVALVALAVRRPRTVLPLLCVGSAAGLLVETRGSDSPEGGPLAHLYATAALGAVGSGWTLGIWESVVAGRGHG